MTEKTFSLPHGKVTLIRGPVHTGKTTINIRLFINELLSNPQPTLTPVSVFLTETENSFFFEKAMEFLSVSTTEDVFKRFIGAGYSVDVFSVIHSDFDIEGALFNKAGEALYKHVFIEEVSNLMKDDELTPEKLSTFAEKAAGIFIVDKQFNENKIFDADMVRNLSDEARRYGLVLETQCKGEYFTATVVAGDVSKGSKLSFTQETDVTPLSLKWETKVELKATV